MNQKPNNTTSGPTFVFGRKNYILMLIGLAVIFLGYILMIGGGSEDPNVFNEDLFDFQRITLAPILILAGFVVEIIAILRKTDEGVQRSKSYDFFPALFAIIASVAYLFIAISYMNKPSELSSYYLLGGFIGDTIWLLLIFRVIVVFWIKSMCKARSLNNRMWMILSFFVPTITIVLLSSKKLKNNELV